MTILALVLVSNFGCWLFTVGRVVGLGVAQMHFGMQRL